jgi:hypothetical protein
MRAGAEPPAAFALFLQFGAGPVLRIYDLRARHTLRFDMTPILPARDAGTSPAADRNAARNGGSARYRLRSLLITHGVGAIRVA